MKELITISLGPLANHAAAHFWNFQDEWLKQEVPSQEGQSLAANTVLYYETEQSRKYVPRGIFVDFRSNFGSYMSCFSQSGNGEAAQREALWNGRLQVNESDRLPQSAFQRELGILEEEEEE